MEIPFWKLRLVEEYIVPRIQPRCPVALTLPGFLLGTLGISQNVLLAPDRLRDRECNGFSFRFELRGSVLCHQLEPLQRYSVRNPRQDDSETVDRWRRDLALNEPSAAGSDDADIGRLRLPESIQRAVNDGERRRCLIVIAFRCTNARVLAHTSQCRRFAAEVPVGDRDSVRGAQFSVWQRRLLHLLSGCLFCPPPEWWIRNAMLFADLV